eukprot:5582341-Pleurochrysis_carterae.AAC.1
MALTSLLRDRRKRSLAVSPNHANAKRRLCKVMTMQGISTSEELANSVASAQYMMRSAAAAYIPTEGQSGDAFMILSEIDKAVIIGKLPHMYTFSR